MSMLRLHDLDDLDDDSFVDFYILLSTGKLMVTSEDGNGGDVCVVISKDDASDLVDFIQEWLGE